MVLFIYSWDIKVHDSAVRATILQVFDTVFERRVQGAVLVHRVLLFLQHLSLLFRDQWSEDMCDKVVHEVLGGVRELCCD